LIEDRVLTPSVRPSRRNSKSMRKQCGRSFPNMTPHGTPPTC